MNSNIKDQFYSYLTSSKEKLNKLNITDNPEDVITLIEEIHDNCLKMLNKIYNYYSIKKNKDFPRPIDKSIKNYRKKIRLQLVASGDENNNKLIDLMNKCIVIINKYDYAIRFLKGDIKHHIEKNPNINKKFKSQAYQYEGIGQEPVLNKDYLDVPGAGRFSKGSNVHMSGVFVQTPTDFTIIQNLEYKPTWESGSYISFEENGKRIKKNLKKWLDQCLKTCKEIIDIS